MDIEQRPGFFDELAEKIISNPRFQEDLSELKRLYIFPTKLSESQSEKTASIKRLAETAGILERSDNKEHKKLALEIASLLVESTNIKEILPGVQGVLKIISSRLGNIPAIRLISSSEINLPLTLGIETEYAKLENTVSVYGSKLELTNFQKQVLEDLSSDNSLSISAPTSGGKSFIIKRFIAEFLLKKNAVIAYVVPTRALISQVQRDFMELFSKTIDGERLIQTVQFITTTEEDLYDREIPKALFILTQERLTTILLGWKEKPVFNFVIVDEVQKISEGARGVILENILSVLANSSNHAQTKFAFLSPFTSNPERIFDLVEYKSDNVIGRSGDISPVAQHIYTVNSIANGKSIKVGYVALGRNREIGSLEIPAYIKNVDVISNKKESEDDIFYKTVITLSHNKPSLIYAPSPKKVIDIALKLSELLTKINSPSSSPSSSVQAAIDKISTHIHQDYTLINLLKAGVAYHYGSMPEMARHLVEDLFSSEEVQYLVCTSTLLEGVNLPAKNIFISKPLAGRAYLSMGAFWNLAGRAGRMQSEISGTVYCINTKGWKTKFYENRTGYQLESAYKEILESDTFLEYTSALNKRTHAPDYPVALNVLIEKYLSIGRENLANFVLRRVELETTKLSHLLDGIEELIQRLNFPPELVPLNLNIDIRLQKALLDQFMTFDAADIQYIVPRPVHASVFYPRLEYIFETCQTSFSIPDEYGHDRIGQQYKYYCLLASKWIKELTIKEIIDEQIAYVKDKSRNNSDDQSKSIDPNEIISQIINDLNGTIRFQYQNYTKCYGDLLAFSLKSRGLLERYNLDFYPGLPNNLELGLYKKLSINLYRAGFSRNAAIQVSRQFDRLELKIAGKRTAEIISDLRNMSSRVMPSLDRFTQEEYVRLIKNL